MSTHKRSVLQPLLPRDRQAFGSLLQSQDIQTDDEESSRFRPYVNRAQLQVRRFLTSKAGHYAVLALVSLDVSCIFADFLISLFICERQCRHKDSGSVEGLVEAQDALGIVSLVFSCLFMAELLASIWAFGLG